MAKGGQKQKYKRNEIELRSFHQSIRLDELIILVGSNVQIGCKMTKLWPSRDWPKVAARLILSHFLAILAIFLEIQPSNLFCPSFLSRVIGKPNFRPIGLKMTNLSHKSSILTTNWLLSQNACFAKRAPWQSLLLLGFKRYSQTVFCMW